MSDGVDTPRWARVPWAALTATALAASAASAQEVGDALRPGANRLEFQVTNEWTNRLLGPVTVLSVGGRP